MTIVPQTRMRFETETALALEAAFDGGRITSDGGLVWLAEMDEELGLVRGHLRVACPSGERGGGATPSPRWLGRGSSR